MRMLVVWGVGLLLAAQAPAQEWRAPGVTSYSGYGQPTVELSIEQQRKLGLSDEQIQKIAEQRRDLEKERAKLEGQLKAASDAASVANAEVARIGQEVRGLATAKLQKIYDSVLTEAQKKTLAAQRLAEQARNWLRGYQSWLKLTDAQMDDLSGLLAPVFDKYSKMETELADARERLAEARRATKLDLAAIEKAEKEVAELSKRNVYQQRQDELMDKMRAGLLPDQLEKLGQVIRR
jgi:predicted  nucleic acid-binding Zn-ribbon protein